MTSRTKTKIKSMIKGLVIGLILIVVAAGFYLGVLNPRQLKGQATVAVTAAANAAGDLANRAGASSSAGSGAPNPNALATAEACRQNLRQLESAKRAIQSRTGYATGSVSEEEIRQHFNGRVPRCPGGGNFILGTSDKHVRCSIGANGTSTGADDHIASF